MNVLGMVAYFCWGIWKARNKYVFDGVKWDARRVAVMACSLFWEFRIASSSSNDCLSPSLAVTRLSPPPFSSSRWLPPGGEGVLKCNVDVSCLASSQVGGGGAVFRDSLDTIVQAVVFSPFPAVSATLAKAICLRKAIIWTGSCLVPQLWFQCDSKVVVQAVIGDAAGPTEIHSLVLDILVVVQKFSFSRLSLVRRNGNEVVHVITKLSRDFLHQDVALVHIPKDILDLAAKDCMSC
ncbi:uncharacterized protein LOC132304841 [Cornus florida]|uniref:uncharacterized protein LOC132304841 n=1 Tax=Cornus florida TaxID=4283 RepID=UPI0028976A7B|nr:uncharacterized protein LOC132304841 [Cornus florida]